MSDWIHTTIKEATVKVGSGATPRGGESAYKTLGTPFIRSMNVHSTGFRHEGLAFLDDEQAYELRSVEVQSGDVLLNITGASIGRVSQVPTDLNGARVSQHVCLIRPKDFLSPAFLRWFLASPIEQTRIMREQTGVTRQGLTKEKLLTFEVPIPPLPEQHRIVEKIEELFSDLDSGVASLERAKANLKRYRASVLKSAVEGRLTEDWRKEHPQTEDGQMLLDRILRERREKWEQDQLLKFKEKGKEPPKNWESKYEEPSAPDTSELPELPEGWLACSLDSVVTIHDDLREPINAKERSTREGEYPYYGATGQVGWIDGYLMDGEYILLGEDGSPFFDLFKHKAYRVDGKAWVNNHAHVLRGVEGILTNQFLLHVLNATNYHPFANGTTRLKLTQGAMRRIPIPLPPLAEQEQIVALVEERLSQIDSAEKTIDAELIRSKRLRQSILKRAFEGKLVPQDPKDEPASVLLERIKASREAEQPKKKAKKVKAK